MTSFKIYSETTAVENILNLEKIKSFRQGAVYLWAGVDDSQLAKLAHFKESCNNFAIVPANFKPKAIFFDMDSTVIGQESIVELAKIAGASEEVSRITEEAMEGKLDFTQALLKRVLTLKGVSEGAFELVYRSFTLNKGIDVLSEKMRERGVKLFLISGGFSPLACRLVQDLKFDGYKANDLEIIDEKLTGVVSSVVVDGAKKASWLQEICEKYDFDISQVLAVGDGANDLEMMGVAGCSLGFNPKAIVRRKAHGTITDHEVIAQLFFESEVKE